MACRLRCNGNISPQYAHRTLSPTNLLSDEAPGVSGFEASPLIRTRYAWILRRRRQGAGSGAGLLERMVATATISNAIPPRARQPWSRAICERVGKHQAAVTPPSPVAAGFGHRRGAHRRARRWHIPRPRGAPLRRGSSRTAFAAGRLGSRQLSSGAALADWGTRNHGGTTPSGFGSTIPKREPSAQARNRESAPEERVWLVGPRENRIRTRGWRPRPVRGICGRSLSDPNPASSGRRRSGARRPARTPPASRGPGPGASRPPASGRWP